MENFKQIIDVCTVKGTVFKRTNVEILTTIYVFGKEKVNSSQNAAQFLGENGFKEVYSMDGGFEEWKNFVSK